MFSKKGTVPMLIAGIAFLASCTCKVSDEQKLTIRELRREEAMLKNGISEKEKSIAGVQAELATRNQESKQCAETLSNLNDKLAQFPTVWSNCVTKPVKPEPVVPEKVKKGKKK